MVLCTHSYYVSLTELFFFGNDDKKFNKKKQTQTMRSYNVEFQFIWKWFLSVTEGCVCVYCE